MTAEHENCPITDALMDTMDALIVVLDTSGRILQFNRACESTTGFSADEVVGRSVLDTLIPPEQRAEVADVLAGLSTPGTNRFENDWITADGRRRRIEWSNAAISDPDGRVEAIIGTGTDVTDQRLLESRLAQADRLESVGRLAAGIAHDFNNALTSLCLRVDRLTARDLDPDSRTDVDAITTMIDRVQALTTELLSFSRPRRPSAVPLDVNMEIARNCGHLEELLGDGTELVLELTAAPATVQLDATAFEHVLTNLVANARDAMPDGGTVTIATANADVATGAAASVDVPGLLAPGCYVRVSVEDTGSGIHGNDLTRVFDPYFTTKPAGRGTGLGLATTYATITQSGGAIAVDSEPGRGAAFDVWLPLATGDVTTTAPTAPATAAADSDESHLALVVDDDAEMRESLVDELRRLGCDAVAAATGEEALRYVDAPIDLLLTDLQLPDVGGDELARRFRRHRPDLWIVYASGAPEARIGAALPDDAVVLAKPFTTAELVAAVREHRWTVKDEDATGVADHSDGTNR